jgi:hypothetical protein
MAGATNLKRLNRVFGSSGGATCLDSPSGSTLVLSRSQHVRLAFGFDSGAVSQHDRLAFGFDSGAVLHAAGTIKYAVFIYAVFIRTKHMYVILLVLVLPCAC